MENKNKKKIVNTTNAPAAIGPYSQGIKVGNLYFFSGQLGINPQSGELVLDFAGQLKQVMQNIDGLLTSENLKRNDIVKTTIFLTDLANFAQVNQAYETFFKAPYPARTTVEVSKLPKNGLVEIEVIATCDE
ncbi:MAG: reactive intermediate/imine deaminase [Bdellovibrionales bacterium RIFOXYD12_FULL_39_22]|nr:MAG: reactive intermediate/imine deaminase [Bdellovibrionales bacterium RIFOXYB1_FULL_39_21]OFZ44202.1 MAG: reactive intermediate/imine deaminase [Bdellovibrionales bacterium RIFOXYC12_FULL_39_17]OFZ46744.1 MAG: reactive intermediate/imine deaminase [Bdellovibrionales bacterium RIFOXYC1_FULL_39_130]OFZ75979.1 MAG: reactive intermediate/imine deaminase [Bdellovibrionales bacterium RIFOXYD1_FULL_39_84]OFZ76486.1 MAG: reactive intermediate/imine deaminase [Bdellovibrionales bacterium RIFOXYC2_F